MCGEWINRARRETGRPIRRDYYSIPQVRGDSGLDWGGGFEMKRSEQFQMVFWKQPIEVQISVRS